MASSSARSLHPGMGQAVAERTILRKVKIGDETRFETWEEVSRRVAAGNATLVPERLSRDAKYGFFNENSRLQAHIANATVLMSGRHLQHGDLTQNQRNIEVFTNCATAVSSFALFMLLLNGSGVGRSYDDDLCLVNWDYAPNLRCVISSAHPDFDWDRDEDVRDAKHKYLGSNVIWHEVADSREGWAKAIEVWETLAFEKVNRDKTLVLDFSQVRPRGAPIAGMQGRPSSGPKPLMGALQKCATVRGSGLAPWLQALYVDHYLAECVLVGGARRSARMSTKSWRDPGVVDFVRVKRPVEYANLDVNQVKQLRDERIKQGLPPFDAFLWSSNNSVMTDAEFWKQLDDAATWPADKRMPKLMRHAVNVWDALTAAAYGDGTGEPGIINADKLVQRDEGWNEVARGDFIGSKKYQIEEDTRVYMARAARAAIKKPYYMITNPCGEIALTTLGGYCVIADVVPFHAETFEEIEDAFRVTTRALMRVNTMDSLYASEVKRTNRIGVGITGIHEFAWKFFSCGFRELIAPNFDAWAALPQDPLEGFPGTRSVDPSVRAAAFWMFMSRMSNAVVDEAKTYAQVLGVNVPHTMITVKPAGTTSKLFGLTEGWHLPSMLEYLRWVQFRANDPLVDEYRAQGYPYRELVKYKGTVIIGFPTRPTICELGIPDGRLVTAGEATPDEQYAWVRLGERFWLDGQTDPRNEASGHGYGNQISYTLKYKPDVVSYENFKSMMFKNQRLVRACSVMPQTDTAAYEYQPEEPLTKARFEEIARAISAVLAEDVGREHVDCAGGVCPINFEEGAKTTLAGAVS